MRRRPADCPSLGSPNGQGSSHERDGSRSRVLGHHHRQSHHRSQPHDSVGSTTGGGCRDQRVPHQRHLPPRGHPAPAATRHGRHRGGRAGRRHAGRWRPIQGLSGHHRGSPEVDSTRDPGGEPDQGHRARHPDAHDPDHRRAAARPSGRGPDRAQPGPGDHGRPGRGQRDRHRGPRRGRRPAVDVLGTDCSGSTATTTSSGARSAGALKNVIAIAAGIGEGLGRRRQHPGGRHDPGPGRADPPGRRHGSRAADDGGPGRHGRPGGNLHEPLQPEPQRG